MAICTRGNLYARIVCLSILIAIATSMAQVEANIHSENFVAPSSLHSSLQCKPIRK